MAEEIINTTEQKSEVQDPEDVKPDVQQETPVDNAEYDRMKKEHAKMKAALDKATREAAEQKRALRAQLSEQERKEAEEAEIREKEKAELAEYRRKFAVAETSKKVMAFIGDEPSASMIAESLYGAEDVDAALDVLQKAWTAKEKALRLEYGKIPAPGVGASDHAMTREEILNIKDPVARQDAIAANMSLFGG